MDTNATTSGLEGVVVADTRLSEVDGERGRLVVAGHDIERLAGAVTFEDVAALLWSGALPDAAGREDVRRALAEGRVAAFERLAGSGDALRQQHPAGGAGLRHRQPERWLRAAARSSAYGGFLRLDNVFDRQYAGSVVVSDANGRYYEAAPGRNWLAGFNASYSY